jgi:hypothetical protein
MSEYVKPLVRCIGNPCLTVTGSPDKFVALIVEFLNGPIIGTSPAYEADE